MTEPIRFVKDIGMYAFSRGRQLCRWPTDWCERYCYNNKFYCVNPKLEEVDKSDNTFWRGAESEQFVMKVNMTADYKPIPRFRFAVRGEIWAKIDDVNKVGLIMMQMPQTLFWIPTRAWRSENVGAHIERFILPMPNARVLASTDPTTTPAEFDFLRRHGWSIVFVGDNKDPGQMLLSEDGECREKKTYRMHHCRKTWEALRGHCAVCTEGCFSEGQVEVHLKKHR